MLNKHRIRELSKVIVLWVVGAFCAVFPFFHKEFKTPEEIYILMLRPLGLGDLMMLSPFVIEIAKRFPNTPTFLVTEYPAFMDIPGVNWLHPQSLNIKKRRHALVISPTLSWHHAKYLLGSGWFLGYFLSNRPISNFTSSSRSYDAKHGHYYQRAVTLLTMLTPWAPGDNRPQYATLISTLVENLALPDNYICIAPVANWEERQYPIDLYRDVITDLVKRHSIVLLGGNSAEEVKLAAYLTQEGVIDLIGKTSLAQAAAIISKAALFVGNDSGLSHMAFLTGTPAVVVFGCVPGELRIPMESYLAKNIKTLGAGDNCPSFPCYDGFNRPYCQNPERFICLKGVCTEIVLTTISNSLENHKSAQKMA